MNDGGLFIAASSFLGQGIHPRLGIFGLDKCHSADARVQYYYVEREGNYWRFAGGLFDDDKQQVGN